MDRLSITLPEEVAQDFYERVERGQRSQFITRAIKEALEKQARWQAFEKLKNFKPYKVDSSSTQVVKKVRSQRQNQLTKKSSSHE